MARYDQTSATGVEITGRGANSLRQRGRRHLKHSLSEQAEPDVNPVRRAATQRRGIVPTRRSGRTLGEEVAGRGPGIVLGTVSGMAIPALITATVVGCVVATEACGEALSAVGGAMPFGSGGGGFDAISIGSISSGGDVGCNSPSPSCKPTTIASFLGALAGSVTYGTILAYKAYEVVGPPLKAHYKKVLPDLFKGWGIGGAAGGFGAAALTAVVELGHHIYKRHQHHQQRREARRRERDTERGERRVTPARPQTRQRSHTHHQERRPTHGQRTRHEAQQPFYLQSSHELQPFYTQPNQRRRPLTEVEPWLPDAGQTVGRQSRARLQTTGARQRHEAFQRAQYSQSRSELPHMDGRHSRRSQNPQSRPELAQTDDRQALRRVRRADQEIEPSFTPTGGTQRPQELQPVHYPQTRTRAPFSPDNGPPALPPRNYPPPNDGQPRRLRSVKGQGIGRSA